MAKYKVEKVKGEWSVVHKATETVVGTETSRDKTRVLKKYFEEHGHHKDAIDAELEEVVEPTTPTEAEVDAIADAEAQVEEDIEAAVDTPAPPKKTKIRKEDIVHETITNDEKVEVITQQNYQATVSRAKELKELLAKSYRKDGGFPSHRYIQRELGFHMSLKAIIRHKRNVVTKTLGLPEDTKVPTTTTLPHRNKDTSSED